MRGQSKVFAGLGYTRIREVDSSSVHSGYVVVESTTTLGSVTGSQSSATSERFSSATSGPDGSTMWTQSVKWIMPTETTRPDNVQLAHLQRS